jgi:hypothetical protein
MKTELLPCPPLIEIVESYLANGRPHTGRHAQFPDGCECEACENWDKLKCEFEDYQSRAPLPQQGQPKIVCLCGSTRFGEAFREWNLRETIAGKIVLSIGCNLKSDSDLIAAGLLKEADKVALDELHKRKIDLADEVLVLNVGGYIGDSTRSEIEYTTKLNKPIRYLEPTLPI